MILLNIASVEPAYPEWQSFGLFEDTMKFVLEQHALNRPVALATLVNTTGGSPRAVGTQMAFTRHDMTGFFSGGCIEADVAIHARATLFDGAPRMLRYGDGSKFRDIRLQCGASISIMTECLMPFEAAVRTYAELRADRKQIIWISDGRLRYAGSTLADFRPEHQETASLALTSEKEAGQGDDGIYWLRHRPRVRLILIGSDPTTLAMARLAKEAEFEVVLVRRSGPSIPPPVEVDLYSTRPLDILLAELGLDDRTAVVFADHDFDSNRETVISLLHSQAGYIGMVGGKGQRSIKENFLREAGLDSEDISRFRSPVGLALGKSTPVAIAISVIAEIVSVMG